MNHKCCIFHLVVVNMLRMVIVVLCSGLLSQLCCEPVVYKTTNLECTTAPKYSINASCILKPINWNKSVAQMDVDLIVPLKNFSVHLQWFKRDYTNKFQPFLVDVEVKLCEIFARKNFGIYGIIMARVFKRFTNLNHSCPYSGRLIARDMYLDEQYVPAFPLGLYKWNFTYMENFAFKPAEFVGSIVIYIQSMKPVIRKKKSNC